MVSLVHEFDPKALFNYIAKCVIVDNGVPQFRVQVFGMPLKEDEVLVSCRDMDEVDILPSVKFYKVPKELREYVAGKHHRHPNEWQGVLSMITEPEAIDEINKNKYFDKLIPDQDIPAMKQLSMIYKDVPKVNKEYVTEAMKRIMELKARNVTAISPF